MRRTCRRCRRCSNIEFDYDKLAEAIVKANRMAEAKSSVPEQTKKVNFFKKVWWIIRNKKDVNYDMLSGLFTIPITALLNFIAFIGGLIFLLGIPMLIHIVKLMSWEPGMIIQQIIGVFFIVVVLIDIALLSLILRSAANEFSREKDRDFIIAVFSGVTGLVALIVALVALFRDNGTSQIITLLGEIKGLLAGRD